MRETFLLKKTAISISMTLHPQLCTDAFGNSMAQVFASGIDKVTTSVVSPDSLAYLVGAYQNRDNHKTSLAHKGTTAVLV